MNSPKPSSPSLRKTKHRSVCDGINQIQLRKLDPSYFHADSPPATCSIENCCNPATHWLTRQNAEYCQSDMVCHNHAILWAEVQDLIQ